MAVAHDATSESHTGAIGSISEASFSWTHTPVGTPKGVIVFVVGLVTSADDSTAVTYGGAAMTAVPGGFAQDTATEPMSCRAWFLGSGLPTGAQSIVVTRNNNTNELWACAATVTAAAGQNTDVHAAGIVLLQENGTLAEQSVTDGSPGTNSVRYAGAASGLAAFPPTGASSTALHDFDTGNQTAAVVRETTAGQGARSVGFSSGTADDRAVVHLAVKEVSASVVVTPATAALTTSLFAPLILLPKLVIPGFLSLALTTFAPTVTVGTIVTLATASLTTTTFAPTVVTPRLVTPPAASLATALFAPTVTIGVRVVPGTAGFVLSTFAPTVEIATGDSGRTCIDRARNVIAGL